MYSNIKENIYIIGHTRIPTHNHLYYCTIMHKLISITKIKL